MRGKSHITLGQYLIRHYMQNLPGHHIKAFLIGCIEPDRNPATYIKGSLRCQWLRGHNYRNARRFMRKISIRLEQKQTLNVLDYYALGKLIHYTADAFTSAHNADFAATLSDHRLYEIQLQDYFLAYLKEDPAVNPHTAKSIMEVIGRYHREYSRQLSDVHRDSTFALHACCSVLSILTFSPTIR